MKPAIGETKSSRRCPGIRRTASLLMATIALVTFGVSIANAQWPTTCVELNDLAEAAAGEHQNVGIYQRVFGAQAEAWCQTDHRDDVRRTFAWALGGEGEAVAGTWPNSCVALNDLAEAARGNPGNVGIYQRAFADDAEAERACRSDHRDDVRQTFAWAIPPDVPEPEPEPGSTSPSTPPTEHPDYQRVRNAAHARSGDADLADAIASDVIGRGAIDSFLRGTDSGVQFGLWSCPRRNPACPLAPGAAQNGQGAQSQAPAAQISDLVEKITVSIVDRGTIDLSNLDAERTYEVLLSSSSPSIVGIGDCLGASEWTTITGSASRTMWFFMRGCAPGTATVTIQVFPIGANSAAASASQQVTVLPIPGYVRREFAESAEEATQSVRDAVAQAAQVRPVLRPFPPRLLVHATSLYTVTWATWWASPPTAGLAITGYQVKYWYWSENDRSKATIIEITDANAWRHTFTRPVADKEYVVNIRACTNQEDCSTAEWSQAVWFTTPPG